MALETAVGCVGSRVVHLVVTVTEPGIEIPTVGVVLEQFLDRSGCQGIETVAETIFPQSLYADPGYDFEVGMTPNLVDGLDEAAQSLYDTYSSCIPMLVTVHANNRGTYFGRMISWPGKSQGGVNQLEARVKALRREHAAGRKTNNTLDIDLAADSESEPVQGLQMYAATDKRQRGFPCLTHIDFTLHNGRLHCLAVYRHQYLIEKAYGNLLGLSRLMRFLCHQTGFDMGELVVHATMADGEQGFADRRTLVADARSALDSHRSSGPAV